jgi:hypothetical protein
MIGGLYCHTKMTIRSYFAAHVAGLPRPQRFGLFDNIVRPMLNRALIRASVTTRSCRRPVRRRLGIMRRSVLPREHGLRRRVSSRKPNKANPSIPKPKPPA